MTQIIRNGNGGGGGGKLCCYVADVSYECWDGEEKAISGDKVYEKVSEMDSTLSTALQPGDNVSELDNDAGYINNAVDDLIYYYLKTDTYSQAEVNALIADFGGFEVVASLPTQDIKTNIIYLLGPIGTGADKYEEWIYASNNWVKIGETSVDLSNYYNKTEVDNLLAQKQAVISDLDTIRTGAGLGATAIQPGDLSAVATSGKYCDLSGTPNLCPIATSGQYCDLTGTPDLSGYQTTANLVCDLTGADNSHYPSAKAVADALQCAGAGDMLKSTYDPNNHNADAFDYCNFTNTPTIPTDNCQLANSCGYTTCTGTLVAGDLAPYAKTCDLSAVATSGKYCDLSGTPSLCNVATSGLYCDLSGTPNLCTVATTGKYCDLTGLPTIPTDNCQLANGCGYTTCTGTLTAANISDTAYGSSWDGVTTKAPSQNAVYDKLSSMDTTISGKQDALSPQTNYTDKGNCTCVPQITTNCLGQVTCIKEVAIDYPVESVNGCTGCVCLDFIGSSNCTYNNIIHLSQAEFNNLGTYDPDTLYSTPEGEEGTFVDNTPFGASWDGVTDKAPSMNAVYDVLGDVETLLANI